MINIHNEIKEGKTYYYFTVNVSNGLEIVKSKNYTRKHGCRRAINSLVFATIGQDYLPPQLRPDIIDRTVKPNEWLPLLQEKSAGQGHTDQEKETQGIEYGSPGELELESGAGDMMYSKPDESQDPDNPQTPFD